jgi:hypothetical protein
MNILKSYEDLVGKTIAFSHMAQFASQITLATTDGDILMVTFELEDDDNMEIRVLWITPTKSQDFHLQKPGNRHMD